MPRTVDPDARRAELCDAVLGIAATEGFDGVTIRRVAAATGASTSAVTHYVSGRAELLRLAVRTLIDRRRAHLRGVADDREPAGALRAVVEWSALDADARDHQVWLAVVVAAPREPVLRDELADFNSWWDALLADLLRAAGGRDDVAVLVDALGVVVDGMIMAGLQSDAPWAPERRGAALDRLLTALGV